MSAIKCNVVSQPVSLDESMVEITNTPVTNRKSLWEDKIAKSNKEIEEGNSRKSPAYQFSFYIFSISI